MTTEAPIPAIERMREIKMVNHHRLNLLRFWAGWDHGDRTPAAVRKRRRQFLAFAKGWDWNRVQLEGIQPQVAKATVAVPLSLEQATAWHKFLGDTILGEDAVKIGREISTELQGQAIDIWEQLDAFVAGEEPPAEEAAPAPVSP